MALEPITRQEQIIAGKGLEPITRMERFLKKYGGGGGASSWNDLTDKPFGEETVTVNEPLNVTWDGNTKGLVSIKEVPIYKVSDVVLNDEQIKTAILTLSSGDTIYIGDVWGELVSSGLVADDSVVIFDWMAAIIRKDNIEIDGIVFPQKGVYLLSINDIYVTSFTTTDSVEHTKTVVHKLDKKYLPETSCVTYFYGDDTYLYWDADLTTKVTAEEFMAAYKGEIRVVTVGNADRGMAYVPFYFNTMNESKSLYYMDINGLRNELYTSEYVEEAPPV